MAKNTLLLTSIGLYQVVRYVVLMVFLVIMLQMSSRPSFSGVALALGGAAVLPTLLLLQLIVTRSVVLIAPLRVALALQLIGAAVTVVQVSGGYASLLGLAPRTLALAGILFLLDVASILFLLSYKPQTSRRDPAQISHQTQGQPQITVEEVEDQ